MGALGSSWVGHHCSLKLKLHEPKKVDATFDNEDEIINFDYLWIRSCGDIGNENVINFLIIEIRGGTIVEKGSHGF